MNFDQQLLRQALGQFATGVCVITTSVKDEKPIGMTANSFAAVSLDPPLVLWSIQKDSDCFAYFENSGHYAVNILAHNQQALSNQYAQKNEHQLLAGSYRIGKTGNPVLKQAITSFECRVNERYEGGDHIILLAEVLHAQTKPSAKPLIFYAGQYRELK